MAAIRMDRRFSREFGVIEVDEDWRIIGFEEKPEEPKTIPGDPEGILASMGVYVFNTEILVRRLIEDARSDSTHDFGKDIIPTMIEKDQGLCLRLSGRGIREERDTGGMWGRSMPTSRRIWI